jgi:hypothetical protein
MNAAHRLIRIIFLCTALLGNPAADTVDCVTKKSALMDKLDSIDMEKQIRKRKGLSLEDLDKKSLILKDSIAEVKMGIHRAVKVPASIPKTQGAPQRFWKDNRFLPKNTFDWVVFIFAAIALIAGAILCIGLLSLLWKTVTIGKKTPLKTMRENISLRDERASLENAADTTEINAEMNPRRIDSLKNRIREESKNIPFSFSTQPPEAVTEVVAQDEAITTDKKEDPGAPHAGSFSSSSVTSPIAAPDVKKLILKAASEGADATEISKRFHVGLDQVSLILRVARQENEKKR